MQMQMDMSGAAKDRPGGAWSGSSFAKHAYRRLLAIGSPQRAASSLQCLLRRPILACRRFCG